MKLFQSTMRVNEDYHQSIMEYYGQMNDELS